MHVKKGDNVYILTGKDRGKTGKILKALPGEDMVLVEGMNIKKVHERAKKSGQKGQIVERSFPIHVSNVKLSTKEAKEPESKPKKVVPSSKKAVSKKS